MAQQPTQYGKLERVPKMIQEPLPYQKRHATDKCCLIFGLFFFITVFILSFFLGDSNNMAKTSLPSDSAGKICGIDYPNNAYLYFAVLPDISRRVCVTACPVAGDSKLSCIPTTGVGCRFTNNAKFMVKYYETQAVSNDNGNFCMPTDPQIRQKLQDDTKLTNRNMFFKSFSAFLVAIAVTFGLSLLLLVLTNFIPKQTMIGVFVLSILSLFALMLGLYLYESNKITIKIVIASLLFVLLILVSCGLWSNRTAFEVSRAFLAYSTSFTKSKPITTLYIFVFTILLLAFFFMISKQYSAFVSVADPTFNAAQGIYYQVNGNAFIITMTVLVVTLLWGLSLIKDAFNFCISNHLIHWYLKKQQGILSTFKLLFLKHFGSVFGGSFVNIFLLLPDMINDIFCGSSNQVQKTQNCCGNTLDLVRSDAYAYIALNGTPYCNSAKYCQYLCNQTMITDGTQSTLRIYRIAAHIFIASFASISALYFSGKIQPYFVIITLVFGVFLSTFFISYQADAAEALQIMFLMSEQFSKRNDTCKKATNIFHRRDREQFLQNIRGIDENHSELADELKQARDNAWKNIKS